MDGSNIGGKQKFAVSDTGTFFIRYRIAIYPQFSQQYLFCLVCGMIFFAILNSSIHYRYRIEITQYDLKAEGGCPLTSLHYAIVLSGVFYKLCRADMIEIFKFLTKIFGITISQHFSGFRDAVTSGSQQHLCSFHFELHHIFCRTLACEFLHLVVKAGTAHSHFRT